MNDLSTSTIKEIVTNDFRTAAIFEKYSLDFCCGGAKTIQQACKEKAVDVSLVLAELESTSSHIPGNESRFTGMELDELTKYIVNTHHKYVRTALPSLLAHTRKVASVHGERHPEVIEIADRFAVVAEELQKHMMKEEHILFPYVAALAKASRDKTRVQRPPFQSAENPICMMEAEHKFAGDEMNEIRSLSFGYTPPADACTTFKVSYQELQHFELDLHNHVHLENNILFPNVVTLEKQMLG